MRRGQRTFRADSKEDRHTCYLRDAVLARYMLLPSVRLSISPFVTSRSSIKTSEWIEPGFFLCVETTLGLSHSVRHL